MLAIRCIKKGGNIRWPEYNLRERCIKQVKATTNWIWSGEEDLPLRVKLFDRLSSAQ